MTRADCLRGSLALPAHILLAMSWRLIACFQECCCRKQQTHAAI